MILQLQRRGPGINAVRAAETAIEAWRKFNDSTKKVVLRRREVIEDYKRNMDVLIEVKKSSLGNIEKKGP